MEITHVKLDNSKFPFKKDDCDLSLKEKHECAFMGQNYRSTTKMISEYDAATDGVYDRLVVALNDLDGCPCSSFAGIAGLKAKYSILVLRPEIPSHYYQEVAVQ